MDNHDGSNRRQSSSAARTETIPITPPLARSRANSDEVDLTFHLFTLSVSKKCRLGADGNPNQADKRYSGKMSRS